MSEEDQNEPVSTDFERISSVDASPPPPPESKGYTILMLVIGVIALIVTVFSLPWDNAPILLIAGVLFVFLLAVEAVKKWWREWRHQ